MTIRRESETTWERVFVGNGDRNDSYEITATEDGLEIGYDLLPWDEIDKARAALKRVGEGNA